MPMTYDSSPIPESSIPRSSAPIFQHLLDTYASETNKLVSICLEFSAEDLSFRPHERSSTVHDILKHQLLSERRFFGEFLGAPEPPATHVLPEGRPGGPRGPGRPGEPVAIPKDYANRILQLALPRLPFLAAQTEPWWLEKVPFFDVERQRIWIFWRRVLHTAHHRTQLTVYLRLLGKRVPSVYGPTADVTWAGADPTRTTDAAGRK